MESSKLNFQQYLKLSKPEQDAYFKSLKLDEIFDLVEDGIKGIQNGFDEIFETAEVSFEKRLVEDDASKKEMDALLKRVMQ